MGLTLRNCAAMVDIETLSTRPDSTIVSIAAILFDPFEINEVNDLFTGHTFYMNVDRNSQPNSHVCPDTLAWWDRQSESARLRLLDDPQPIDIALRELHNFLCFRQDQTHPPAHELWANGPNFDCVILESAYSKYSRFKLPIPFMRQYDVRTTKELAWRHGGAPLIEVGVAHNALDDCVKQALYVQAAHVVLGITPPR